jgi:hypothetical protein
MEDVKRPGSVYPVLRSELINMERLNRLHPFSSLPLALKSIDLGKDDFGRLQPSRKNFGLRSLEEQ